MDLAEVDIQTNSGIQAINIPDEFKINDDKVYLKRMGNAIYIIPFHNPWQNVKDGVDAFTPDFMENRNQGSEQIRESFD